MKELFRKYREVILYLFFGVCTTAINTVCYALLYTRLGVGNTPSTVIAWVVAVLFAFVTNRRFVFDSRRSDMAGKLKEMLSFFGCRVSTGLLDVVIMAIAVDRLHRNGVVWKLISNAIVIVLNYVASKFLIFRKTGE